MALTGQSARWPGRRATVVALAGAVLAGTAAPGGAQAAPTVSAPTVSAAGVATPPAPATTLTLVTGDRVVARTGADGRLQVAFLPRSEQQRSYLSQQIGADLYVIPAGTVPYLGRSLDPALFDVSALLRDGAADRLPVRVTFAAGARQAPAGVTLAGARTATAAATATTRDGYLTAGGAQLFGAALARQAGADARAGWVGDRRLFGGITSVRFAGATQPAVIQPAVIHPLFQMFTVRFSVLGLQGEPAPFGAIGVINVDDGRKFVGIPAVVDGDARISVPAGHYSAFLDYPVLDSAGNTVQTRLVLTDFEVTGAGTVTLDARAATSQVAVRTPRPAEPVSTFVQLFRGSDDATGLTAGIEGGPAPVYLSPAPAATIGGQHFTLATILDSPAGTRAPYGYRLEFPSADGSIAADQRYVPGPVATVAETFYADVPEVGGITRFATLPWEPFGMASTLSFDRPQRRTEYLTTRPDLTYFSFVFASHDDVAGPIISQPRTYPRPVRTSEEWHRQPLAVGFSTAPSGQSTVCVACRNGDLLSILLSAVTDSTPDHIGFLDLPDRREVTSSSRFQLLSGDTVIDDETSAVGVTSTDFTVPPAAAPYRIVYDETRLAPWFTLSPTSHTEWTFTSAHSDRNTVPDRLSCDGTDQACSAVPLLTLNARLSTDLAGTMRPGSASLLLTVGHTDGAPRPPAVRAAHVSLSFDGGRTWTRLALHALGGGRFRAAWTNPAAGGAVDLRVGADDRAGGTVSQTVQRAFTITPGHGRG